MRGKTAAKRAAPSFNWQDKTVTCACEIMRLSSGCSPWLKGLTMQGPKLHVQHNCLAQRARLHLRGSRQCEQLLEARAFCCDHVVHLPKPPHSVCDVEALLRRLQNVV